jgi:metal-responsive CopG/Arc/MetJ family transcriptional regulator
VRINVMLPEDLIKAIDRATNNRSRFLADAAKQKLRELV